MFGLKTSDQPDPDQDDLRAEVGDRQDQVEPRRLLGPLHVQRREEDDHAMPPMMSPGESPSGGQNTAR